MPHPFESLFPTLHTPFILPKLSSPPYPVPGTQKVTRRTGWFTHELFLWHTSGNQASGADNSGYEPEAGVYMQASSFYEHESTKRRFKALIEVCGLVDLLITTCTKRSATIEELSSVHCIDYINEIITSSKINGGNAGECAFYGVGSYEIAAKAAGYCISAVSAVLSGEVDNAYVLCRPPGHHAEHDRGRGFCLFSNCAIAAEHALSLTVKGKKVERVLIIDYDVHHGNGTQQKFYGRDDVLFISIHEMNLYPIDSGEIVERGEGHGEHFNVNCPMPPGSGHGAYVRAFDQIVAPLVKAFRPDVILVSSGFDASSHDPLGHMMLSSSTYGVLTKKIIEYNKPCAFFHEGGYSENSVPFCGLRCVEELCGVEKSNVVDTSDDEVLHYGMQDLQAHQEQAVFDCWEGVAKECVRLCGERGYTYKES